MPKYDVDQVRSQFPLLSESSVAYLDSASSTQKPRRVIETVSGFYEKSYANVHRGIYALSEEASSLYEATRKDVQQFINAQSDREIIFTRGATESINLVATTFGQLSFRAGDEILISAIEHHANIVPWQQLCSRTGALLRIIPMNDEGALDLDAYQSMLNERTRLVGLIQVSNVLGVANPVKEMVAKAHQVGAAVLVDGTQAVAHMPVDVRDLDCDFYVFSSHKMYGPTGVGVLYGKESWLEKMPPYQFGGDMIETVSFTEATFNTLPFKFEAGTPNIAGVVGLGEAVKFVQSFDWDLLTSYEASLHQQAKYQLQQVEGLQILSQSVSTTSAISFVLKSAHAHDVATVLDSCGVAVRAGHHCAMPLMSLLGVAATIRVSIAAYTTKDEIDQCVSALNEVNRIFNRGVSC